MKMLFAVFFSISPILVFAGDMDSLDEIERRLEKSLRETRDALKKKGALKNDGMRTFGHYETEPTVITPEGRKIYGGDKHSFIGAQMSEESLMVLFPNPKDRENFLNSMNK